MPYYIMTQERQSVADTWLQANEPIVYRKYDDYLHAKLDALTLKRQFIADGKQLLKRVFITESRK